MTEPSASMVERVARKLCAFDGVDPDAQCDGPAGEVWIGWFQYASRARAAIEAMGEPTEAMLRAGYEATHSPNAAPAGGFTRWATWEELLECPGLREEKAVAYRAMINAALEE